MLTARFRIAPDVPENDTADDGHDDGFADGSAIQTRPVTAPARGSARGVESETRSKAMKARSFLEAFKNFSSSLDHLRRVKDFSSHTAVSLRITHHR